MSDPIYVSLEKSGLPEIPVQPAPGEMLELPGDRRIMVGKCLIPEPHLLIRIECPAPDGKVALTQFGLRIDAAEALLILLKHAL